jgi:hypothetical protein
VLFVGHTHLPFAPRLLGGGLIANPGALLRDPAEPMGQGMLWDREAGRFVPGPAPVEQSDWLAVLRDPPWTVR